MSELGDWLAENVMGWQTCRRCTTPHYLDADGEWVPGYTSWDPEHVDTQAMQVLDKMIALGWYGELAHNYGNTFVSCRFGKLETGPIGTCRDTRAEAICSAARAAIEAERAAAKPKPHRCMAMFDFVRWELTAPGGIWQYKTDEDEIIISGARYCHLCGAKLGR